MSIFGVGPWLALVGAISFSIVYVLRTLGLSFPVVDPLLQIFGLFWGAIGLWFWIGSIVLITRSHRRHKLITDGVYGYSRNPMYAAFIVFLVPAFSFVSGELSILLVSAVMFAAFKVLIRKEEVCLKREFGEEYGRYAKEVAQLIPFVRV